MGLFNGKQKRLQTEEKIKTILRENPILQNFDNQIKNVKKEDQWIYKTTSYYDNRIRTVAIGDDYIVIHMCDSDNLTSKKTKEVPSIGLKFTDYGYTPITSYDKKDEVMIYQERVLYLLAEIIQEKIEKVCNGCELGEIGNANKEFGEFECVYFEYKVPEYPWMTWF